MFNNKKAEYTYIRRIVSAILLVSFIVTSSDVALALAPSGRIEDKNFQHAYSALDTNTRALDAIGESLYLKMPIAGVRELVKRRVGASLPLSVDRVQDGAVYFSFRSPDGSVKYFRCFRSDDENIPAGATKLPLSGGRSYFKEELPAPDPFSVESLLAVRDSIGSYTRETPLVELPALSKITGKTVLLKDESRQIGGSFKTRGVTYEVFKAIQDVIDRDPELLKKGLRIVTQTDGNHGGAMIRAVTSAIREFYERRPDLKEYIRKIEPVVFTFKKVSAVKLQAMIQAMKEYRAVAKDARKGKIELVDGDYADALKARTGYIAGYGAGAFYMEHGGIDIMQGHATASIEIAEQLKSLGISEDKKVCLIIPVGAGGPIGLAEAIKKFRTKNVTVIMVQTPRYAAFVDSFKSGKLSINKTVTEESPYTVTADGVEFIYEDGIAVDGPESEYVLSKARQYIDDAVLADPQRALDNAAPLVLADLDRYYGARGEGEGVVGGTTAITADALLNVKSKFINEADVVVLFGTEGNVEPDLLAYTRKKVEKLSAGPVTAAREKELAARIIAFTRGVLAPYRNVGSQELDRLAGMLDQDNAFDRVKMRRMLRNHFSCLMYSSYLSVILDHLAKELKCDIETELIGYPGRDGKNLGHICVRLVKSGLIIDPFPEESIFKDFANQPSGGTLVSPDSELFARHYRHFTRIDDKLADGLIKAIVPPLVGALNLSRQAQRDFFAALSVDLAASDTFGPHSLGAAEAGKGDPFREYEVGTYADIDNDRGHAIEPERIPSPVIPATLDEIKKCRALSLVVNPGSTSNTQGATGAKVGIAGVIDGKFKLFETDIELLNATKDTEKDAARIIGAVLEFLQKNGIELNSISTVCGRGGLLKPTNGGLIRINNEKGADGRLKLDQAIWYDLVKDPLYKFVHESNMGAIIAADIASRIGEKGVPAFILDPVTTYALDPVFRHTGRRESENVPIWHALNCKAVIANFGEYLTKVRRSSEPVKPNAIVVHMGGGTTVAAFRDGVPVRVTNALAGSGVMSVKRGQPQSVMDIINTVLPDMEAGAGVLDAVLKAFCKNAGMEGYLGTNSLIVVEQLIEKGRSLESGKGIHISQAQMDRLISWPDFGKQVDYVAGILKPQADKHDISTEDLKTIIKARAADFVLDIFAHKISGGIGDFALTAVKRPIDGIIFTGGGSKCGILVGKIVDTIKESDQSWPIYLSPGSLEQYAMARESYTSAVTGGVSPSFYKEPAHEFPPEKDPWADIKVNIHRPKRVFPIKHPRDILTQAKKLAPKSIVIAEPNDISIESVLDAAEAGIINKAYFTGDGAKIGRLMAQYSGRVKGLEGRGIRCEVIHVEPAGDKAANSQRYAIAAIKLVKDNKADFVMKGGMDTGVMLKELLKKEGLGAGRLASYVTVTTSEVDGRTIISTDAAINVRPAQDHNPQIMVDIIQNAVNTALILGIKPRVAIISGNEKVVPKLPYSVLSKKLSDLPWPAGVTVDGPISWDVAFNPVSAEEKDNYEEGSEALRKALASGKDIKEVTIRKVAGTATIEVETGFNGANATYKKRGVKASSIIGAAVPSPLASRGDPAENKLLSMALSILILESETVEVKTEELQGLNIRAAHALEWGEISTVDELKRRWPELISRRNFAMKSFKEIQSALAKLSVSLTISGAVLAPGDDEGAYCRYVESLIKREGLDLPLRRYAGVVKDVMKRYGFTTVSEILECKVSSLIERGIGLSRLKQIVETFKAIKKEYDLKRDEAWRDNRLEPRGDGMDVPVEWEERAKAILASGVKEKSETFVFDADTKKPVPAVLETTHDRILLKVGDEIQGTLKYYFAEELGRYRIIVDSVLSEDQNRHGAYERRYEDVGLRLIQEAVRLSMRSKAKGGFYADQEEKNSGAEGFFDKLAEKPDGLRWKTRDNSIIWYLEPQGAQKFLDLLERRMEAKKAAFMNRPHRGQLENDPVAVKSWEDVLSVLEDAPEHKYSEVMKSGLALFRGVGKRRFGLALEKKAVGPVDTSGHSGESATESWWGEPNIAISTPVGLDDGMRIKFNPGAVCVVFEISDKIADEYGMSAEFNQGMTHRDIPLSKIRRAWAVRVDSRQSMKRGVVRMAEITIPGMRSKAAVRQASSSGKSASPGMKAPSAWPTANPGPYPGNPYGTEDNIARNFSDLDGQYLHDISDELSDRTDPYHSKKQKGLPVKMLVLGVGRGLEVFQLIHTYTNKIEVTSTSKEDLVYRTPEELLNVLRVSITEDEARSYIDRLRQRYLRCDLDEGIPAEDGYFDVVVIDEFTMAYVKDKYSAMREMLRVCRPGGVIYCSPKFGVVVENGAEYTFGEYFAKLKHPYVNSLVMEDIARIPREGRNSNWLKISKKAGIDLPALEVIRSYPLPLSQDGNAVDSQVWKTYYRPVLPAGDWSARFRGYTAENPPSGSFFNYTRSYNSAKLPEESFRFLALSLWLLGQDRVQETNQADYEFQRLEKEEVITGEESRVLRNALRDAIKDLRTIRGVRMNDSKGQGYEPEARLMVEEALAKKSVYFSAIDDLIARLGRDRRLEFAYDVIRLFRIRIDEYFDELEARYSALLPVSLVSPENMTAEEKSALAIFLARHLEAVGKEYGDSIEDSLKIGLAYIARMKRTAADGFVAAFYKEKPVGIISYSVQGQAPGARYDSCVNDLFVDPYYRGGGIAKTLLKQAAIAIAAKGAKTVAAVVDSNPSAQDFWKSVSPDKYLTKNAQGVIAEVVIPLADVMSIDTSKEKLKTYREMMRALRDGDESRFDDLAAAQDMLHNRGSDSMDASNPGVQPSEALQSDAFQDLEILASHTFKVKYLPNFFEEGMQAARYEALNESANLIHAVIEKELAASDKLSDLSINAVLSVLKHLIPNSVDTVYKKIDDGLLPPNEGAFIGFEFIYNKKTDSLEVVLWDHGLGIERAVFKGNPDQEHNLKKTKGFSPMYLGGVGKGLNIALSHASGNSMPIFIESKVDGQPGYRLVQDESGNREIVEFPDIKEGGTRITVHIPVKNKKHAKLKSKAEDTPEKELHPSGAPQRDTIPTTLLARLRLARNRYLLRINEERLAALKTKTVQVPYYRGDERSYKKLPFSEVNPIVYSRRAASLMLRIKSLKRRIEADLPYEASKSASPGMKAPEAKSDIPARDTEDRVSQNKTSVKVPESATPQTGEGGVRGGRQPSGPSQSDTSPKSRSVTVIEPEVLPPEAMPSSVLAEDGVGNPLDIDGVSIQFLPKPDEVSYGLSQKELDILTPLLRALANFRDSFNKEAGQDVIDFSVDRLGYVSNKYMLNITLKFAGEDFVMESIIVEGPSIKGPFTVYGYYRKSPSDHVSRIETAPVQDLVSLETDVPKTCVKTVETILTSIGMYPKDVTSSVEVGPRALASEGDFNKFGRALNDKARRLSLLAYQEALNEFNTELRRIVDRGQGSFSVKPYVYGSIAKKDARLGIYRAGSAPSFNDVRQLQGIDKRAYADREQSWPTPFAYPSDLDVLLVVDSRNNPYMDRAQMHILLDPVVKKIFETKGVYVHFSDNPDDTDPKIPMENMVGNSLVSHYTSSSSTIKVESAEVKQAEKLASLIKMYALEAKTDERVIIGIEIGAWTPGEQDADMQALSNAVRQFVYTMKTRGMLDNVEVVLGNSETLATNIASEKPGKMDKVIAMGSEKTLTKPEYKDIEGALLACVDLKELGRFDYINFVGVLATALDIALSKNTIAQIAAAHSDITIETIGERIVRLIPLKKVDIKKPSEVYRLQIKELAKQA